MRLVYFFSNVYTSLIVFIRFFFFVEVCDFMCSAFTTSVVNVPRAFRILMISWLHFNVQLYRHKYIMRQKQYNLFSIFFYIYIELCELCGALCSFDGLHIYLFPRTSLLGAAKSRRKLSKSVDYCCLTDGLIFDKENHLIIATSNGFN